jgi:uncharacterized membrane protein YraQ (UPF0718 family)
MIDAVERALSMAFAMGWEILWPLILGFTLSGVVQAIVSRGEMSRLLPDDPARLRPLSPSGQRRRRALTRRWLWRGRSSAKARTSPPRAGALAAWVPHAFWQSFFLTGHPILATLWGPIVGPLVAVISFVCSVGNIPLAAVLWNGGISFGGVIAFIFADLIVVPVLNIYRKYYGLKMASFLFVTFYAAMAIAALIVEVIFGGLGLIPSERHARVVEASITWNYTTWLNVAFLALAGLLVWRFLRTGGLGMLRMMNRPAETGHAHHTH